MASPSSFDPTEAPSFDPKPVEALRSTLQKLQSALDFDKERETLSTLELKLPLDPVKEGLTKLHLLLANCQDLQDRSTKLLSAAVWTHSRWENLSSAIESLYKTRQSRVLSETPSIQALRNSQLQEAAAAQVLKPEKDLVDRVELETSRAKAFLDLCRIRHENLQDTNQAISRQIKVIIIQVEIGEVASTGTKVGSLRGEL